MPSYLVESYAPDTAVQDQRNRAQLAAELGTGIHYVRTIFLPGDETVWHLFEARSPEALHEAARDAALPHERIVDAVEGSNGAREEQHRKGRDLGPSGAAACVF